MLSGKYGGVNRSQCHADNVVTADSDATSSGSNHGRNRSFQLRENHKKITCPAHAVVGLPVPEYQYRKKAGQSSRLTPEIGKPPLLTVNRGNSLRQIKALAAATLNINCVAVSGHSAHQTHHAALPAAAPDQVILWFVIHNKIVR